MKESEFAEILKQAIDTSTIVRLENPQSGFTSSAEAEGLLNNIFPGVLATESSSISAELKRSGSPQESSAAKVLADSVVLRGWKYLEGISSRVAELHDDSVVLECLIDRENKIFEERTFPIVLFEGKQLEPGTMVFLKVFSRSAAQANQANELRLEAYFNSSLSDPKDFAKVDLRAKMEKSILFKK